MKLAPWLWLLPFIPLLAGVAVIVGIKRTWPVGWILSISHAKSTPMWLSFLIAAYIYGLQTPSTLAPFVVAFLVALIVSIVLLIKAWGDEDKPRPVRAHNPKVAFFHMLVGFHIPMAAITLALLSRDEIDRRVIVIGLVLFLLIFGLTWYTVWERIRENLKADSLK